MKGPFPSRFFSILVCFCCAMITGPASGRFARPDLKKVPIATLIENLEKQAAESATAEHFHHLARAHAMAYARGLGEREDVDVLAETGLPWFGHQPPLVPYTDTKTVAGTEAGKVARAHLQRAVECYGKAVMLAPDDGTLRLGQGWCIEQSGSKADAIAAYRKAIEIFWKEDAGRTGTFGPVGTVEAAGYLLPLLDPDKNASEIAELRARVKKIEGLPRAITPIAVALRPEITPGSVLDPAASVRFDADGSGRRDAWNWISTDAAWLVHDNAGNGEIDSAIQMFGNRTFMLFLADGYAAMRLLDGDGDGLLSGGELEHLALWHDRDSDGVSDPGEVLPVGDHGIESLRARPAANSGGVLWCPDGVRYADGTAAPSFDVILQRQLLP